MKKQVYIAPYIEVFVVGHCPLLKNFSISAEVDEWEPDDDVDINAEIDISPSSTYTV